MMLIQKVSVGTAWDSVMDLLYTVRGEEPPLPTPHGASIYFSLPPDFSGKVFGADVGLIDQDTNAATLLDGAANTRFVSFEVDDLNSVLLKADEEVTLSVIVKTWR